MLVTDLPKLLPAEYGAANDLREEVRRALDYAAMYPNSAVRINEFFAALAGGSLPDTSAIVEDGDTVTASGTGTTATLTVVDGVLTGVALS